MLRLVRKSGEEVENDGKGRRGERFGAWSGCLGFLPVSPFLFQQLNLFG